MALIEIFGDDSGAGNRRPAFGDQHRRGACRVERQKRLAPLPDPLFHQPQIEAVFAERQPDEARMGTERMMKQREHEAFDSFTTLRKPLISHRWAGRGSAPNYRSARMRQPVFWRFLRLR